MTATPRQLGFRMPAEWQPHAATWLSWPHRLDTWPGKFEPIPLIFAEVVRHLSPGEEIHISVNSQSMGREALDVIRRNGALTGNVHFHTIPTDDAWSRDHGPTFLVRETAAGTELAVVDWIFNSWGGKYPPFDLDDQVPARIAAELGVPCFSPGIVMEGGSFDVNGAGSLLTSESCLLNKNRNPDLSKSEIEKRLEDYLGVTNILWLGQGIEGDDTDGHIDDLARFIDPRTLVTVVEDDPEDPNYGRLQENLRRLRLMRDQSGRPFEVVTLPMPSPIFHEGQRLPCSYANFYIGNSAVLVPSYDPHTDPTALAILQRLFPGRKVVGIEAIDLAWGLGAFHCITQQQPLAGPGRP